MRHDIKAVSYAVGMTIGQSLLRQDLNELDTQTLTTAIAAVLKGEQAEYSDDEAQHIISGYLQARDEAKFAGNKQAGNAFLEENAKRSEVSTTASGLQYEVIEEGSGTSPSANSTVEVHYHGTLINGTVFDSSIQRGAPATFGVHQVIRGWTEALQLMKEGAKYRLYIPEDLAYGANPHPGGPIEPYMTLVFDVELLRIVG